MRHTGRQRFSPQHPNELYEYMCIKITNIPEEITKEYKLHEIVTDDGYIFTAKFKKGYTAYHRQE
jgi:hypothetical protein